MVVVVSGQRVHKYKLDTLEALSDYTACIEDGTITVIKQIENVTSGLLNGQLVEFEIAPQYLQSVPAPIDDVINGKNKESNIVNISVKNNKAYIYKEYGDKVVCEEKPFKFFALAPTKLNSSFDKLKGSSYYNYIKYYSEKELLEVKSKLYKSDCYFINHAVESYMMMEGYTYHKDMKLKDVSIMSFDIETTGVNPHAKDARILCIGNTVRRGDKYFRRMFRCDKYKNNGEMLLAWAEYVRQSNPSVITGYNIVMFDLPYLLAEADRFKVDLDIGRDGSAMRFEKRTKPRSFRKDGSQEYDYHRVEAFGREIVDMWMVTIKFDVVAKKYDSYALKHIIKIEGMEKEGRTFYDASKIKEDWNDESKRDDICNYCMDDSEDPIKLADMMLTPSFLFTSYIPKPFQCMIESNTGGQINSLMMRSYLQEGWAVPKGDETTKFQGAISEGFPGIYKNVLKFDVSSLYPSIMRQYEIKPRKDYLGNFLKMLEYFTLQRIKNKRIAKELKDTYHDDLQNMQKIGINSSYGFLTTQGLNFNDMDAGSSVTRYGREVLEKSILWASGRTYRDLVPETKEDEDETI